LAATGLGIIITGIVSIVIATSVLNEYDVEEEEAPDDYEAFTDGLTPSLQAASTTAGDLDPVSGPSPSRKSKTPRGLRKHLPRNNSYSALPALTGSFTASFGSEHGDLGGFVQGLVEGSSVGEDVPRDAGTGGAWEYARGVLCAMLCAVFAGSCLVPVNLNQNAGGATGIIYSVVTPPHC